VTAPTKKKVGGRVWLRSPRRRRTIWWTARQPLLCAWAPKGRPPEWRYSVSPDVVSGTAFTEQEAMTDAASLSRQRARRKR